MSRVKLQDQTDLEFLWGETFYAECAAQAKAVFGEDYGTLQVIVVAIGKLTPRGKAKLAPVPKKEIPAPEQLELALPPPPDTL